MNIRKQLVKRNIAGDVILVPVGDASLEIKGLLTLNETGELLWDALPEAADEAAHGGAAGGIRRGRRHGAPRRGGLPREAAGAAGDLN